MSSTKQLSRSSIQAAIHALREHSDKLLDSVSPETLDSTLATPLWSCSDVLRHLLSWNTFTVDCIHSWQQDHSGKLPRASQLDDLNAQLLKRYRHLSASQARQLNNEAHAAMVAMIEQASDEELELLATPPVWGVPITRLAMINDMIEHDHEHLEQIEEALGKAKHSQN